LNNFKTDKIEIKLTEAQKQIIRQLAKEQNMTMTDYFMKSLYMKLDKDGRILNFLNNEIWW
jgi:uncharacterized protein (DUF1778 family)